MLAALFVGLSGVSGRFPRYSREGAARRQFAGRIVISAGVVVTYAASPPLESCPFPLPGLLLSSRPPAPILGRGRRPDSQSTAGPHPSRDSTMRKDALLL